MGSLELPSTLHLAGEVGKLKIAFPDSLAVRVLEMNRSVILMKLERSLGCFLPLVVSALLFVCFLQQLPTDHSLASGCQKAKSSDSVSGGFILVS